MVYGNLGLFLQPSEKERHNMAIKTQTPPQNDGDTAQLDKLTRQQLRDLETKEKTPLQKALELIILCLPLVCGGVAILEYLLIPDNSLNRNPNTYLVALILFILMYVLYGSFAGFKRWKGDKRVYEKLRHNAPLISALFLLLAFYDYLTLKTGVLTQPFVPCMNFVLNAAWMDRAMIWDCTLHTLWLLFLGYFSGVSLGLITGMSDVEEIMGLAWTPVGAE